jgi:hypothetical protein
MRLVSLTALAFLSSAPQNGAHAQKPIANVENAVLASFTMKYTITAAPGSKLVKLDVLIPRTLAGRQRIVEIQYSLKPTKKFDRDGNSYAEFLIANPKRSTEIFTTATVEVFRYDLSVASKRKTNRQFEDKKELKKWLVHEQYLEKDAPEIQKAAKALLAETEEETIRKTLAFVVRTLQKTPFVSTDHGAVWALEKRQGDCTEFADLFISLCRANGLPARFRNGYLIHDVPKGDTPIHDWAEVYLAKYGWVPFDPLAVHQGSATVEDLRPIYVYLDNQRRNAVLNDHHFFAFHYQGDAVQVRHDVELKSRKAIAPK